MAERAPIPETVNSPLAALPPSLAFRRASDLGPATDILPTGFASVDAFLGGGLAFRHIHLIAGMLGAGSTSLMHGLLATVTRTQPVLLLDPYNRFFPPAAAAAGAHLPHLLRVPVSDDRKLQRALAFALRSAAACPLIVWDTETFPPAFLLDRLRPLVRGSGSALLIVTDSILPSTAAIDGATLVVRHERWVQVRDGRPGCHGKTVLVAVTDRPHQRSATFPLTMWYPHPLPPLLRLVGKEVTGDAGTPSRGDLAAGIAAPGRWAG